MYYKYNSRIAKTILRVIGEIPSQVNYETVRYPERMTYYSIRKKVYERLSHDHPPYYPSQSHFDKNMLDLVKWNLLIKKTTNKKKYSFGLTDFGKICNTYDYEPSEYYRLYMIWGLIAFRAFQGVLKNPDKIDSLSSPVSHGPYHPIPGITAEDILKYKSRIRIPHNLLSNEKFTEEEIRYHIHLLEEKKILIQNDNNHFILSSKYYKLVVFAFIFLVRDIQLAMSLKWKTISGSKPEERKWYQFWFGDKEAEDTIKTHILKRSNYKDHLILKDLLGCRKRIQKLNDQIVRDYKMIEDTYKGELEEIPGFAKTLLSYACPTEIKYLLEKRIKIIS